MAKKKPAPKIGRPAKPVGEKFRTPMLSIRVPDDVKARIVAGAEAAGVTVTAYMLEAVEVQMRKDGV